jgi:glycosyltransferase involved in cell wall biosynthesis
MRIAIDSGTLKSKHGVRGVGVYARELIKALGDRVEALDFANTDLSQYDLAHVPFFSLFLANPYIGIAKKTVVTIHDVIPLLFPDHYPPGIRGFIRLFLNKRLLKSVDGVITNSEVSKSDIAKFLGVPKDKIFVTYLGAGINFKSVNEQVKKEVIKKYNLPKKFVFYLGDINYNKNIPTLIKACKRVGIHLVIAGKSAMEVEKMDFNHAEHVHLKEIYDDLTNPRIVTRVGHVTDLEASAIYELASVYVQPSFYEGFGLSVIHAFALGCPVVAADTPALVEIGKGACLFADPKNAKDFAEKIEKVIKDQVLRNQLIETGRVLVKSFTWEKTAEKTLNVYKNC